MPLPFRWIIAILAMAGILVSWEPGPDLTGHSHAHGTGHELLPPHEVPGTFTHGGNTDPAGTMESPADSADFHYHAASDFSYESCTGHPHEAIRLISQGRSFPPGTHDRLPDSPFDEVDHPPLI